MVYTHCDRENKRRIAALCALTATVLIGGIPKPAEGAETPSRVRSTNATVLTLVREGAARSVAFRSLVDQIERSNGIVYVEFGTCAFGHLNACLLAFVVPSHGERYLRVLLTAGESRRNHDQLLALVAHELQHACEVLEHPEVVDIATLNSLYEHIGVPLTGGLSGYETSAARAAGDRVLTELRTPVRPATALAHQREE
jgi:hypothetical protein